MEIENLKALIEGIKLNAYQKALAVKEFEHLLASNGYEYQALSMSGVSEWISVETPPHDQETVLLIDSYNQISTGYFHGPKSGFIWDAPDLHDPIKWKPILK